VLFVYGKLLRFTRVFTLELKLPSKTGMGKHFSINIFGSRTLLLIKKHKHLNERYKENCSYYLYWYSQSYENFA